MSHSLFFIKPHLLLFTTFHYLNPPTLNSITIFDISWLGYYSQFNSKKSLLISASYHCNINWVNDLDTYNFKLCNFLWWRLVDLEDSETFTNDYFLILQCVHLLFESFDSFESSRSADVTGKGSFPVEFLDEGCNLLLELLTLRQKSWFELFLLNHIQNSLQMVHEHHWIFSQYSSTFKTFENIYLKKYRHIS